MPNHAEEEEVGAEPGWPLGARLLSWILAIIAGAPLACLLLYLLAVLIGVLFPR